MAFDGAFLACVCNEVNEAIDAHIDKIYQPSRDELVLVLRKKGFCRRLLLSAKSGMARMHFTELRAENPETPPTFCMLARKYFSAAKLTGIKMQGMERVAELCFSATNELGDRVTPKIICEFIGGAANIILLSENGRIIDALHRSDILKFARITAPGAAYEYPAKRDRENLLNCDIKVLCGDILSSAGELSKCILNCTDGLSPLVCRETAYRAYGADVNTADIKEPQPLEKALSALAAGIKSGGTPYIIKTADGEPKEFSFTQILQYGGGFECEKRDSYSALLDEFYLEKEKAYLRKKAGGDLQKVVANVLARTRRRKAGRREQLEAAKDREKLRVKGELIKANIYACRPGDTSVTVQNFYDPQLSLVRIELNPALSAAANAAAYFKEYKKQCGAEKTLGALIEKDAAEEYYLESVAESLSRAESASDIADIRRELSMGGYIKEKGEKRAKKAAKQPAPLTYESTEGYKILVGKNNLQNDYITTVLAGKNDMWFHTKNIHGAHVAVLSGGAPLSDETLTFAARLAAANSKAAHSSNVPVDYTLIKNVKKPSGAKAGMVIYTGNKTLFVTPEEFE